MSVELDGFEELERNLTAIQNRTKQAVKFAAVAGADVLAMAIGDRAPIADVIVTKRRRSSRTRATVDIGPNKKHWHLRFFEFGAQPHEIQSKGGYPLVFEGISGDMIKTGRVKHPGMAARPFMRPAVDASASDAVEAAGAIFWIMLGAGDGGDEGD